MSKTFVLAALLCFSLGMLADRLLFEDIDNACHGGELVSLAVQASDAMTFGTTDRSGAMESNPSVERLHELRLHRGSSLIESK